MYWISPVRGMLSGMVLTLLFLTGCGGGSANKPSVVSGKVTYKGQPLTTGSIVFHGPGGKNVSSTIGPDGSFRIPDVAVGENTVTVSVPPPVKPPPGGLPPGMGGPSVTSVPIPESFADPAKSGVKQTVAAGETTINIDLK